MEVRNFEFKAKVKRIEEYEKKLLKLNPEYKGTDHQVDTYFNVKHGRLKLREGNIENALINYDRDDIADSKLSQITLYKHQPDTALKNILVKQLGIRVVVDKKRKIYFIDNVKFHFDIVKDLGTYIEVEAIDKKGKFSLEELKAQCDYYTDYFQLNQTNFVDQSYSDLVIALKSK